MRNVEAEALALLCDLVRIDSVNMGCALTTVLADREPDAD
jgi:hypothetical protein